MYRLPTRAAPRVQTSNRSFGFEIVSGLITVGAYLGAMKLGDYLAYLYDSESYLQEEIASLEEKLNAARSDLAKIRDAKVKAEAEASNNATNGDDSGSSWW